MRLLWLAVLVTAALLGLPASTGAQASLGAGGIFVSLAGADFEGTDAGFGGEATVLFAVGPSVKVGAGAQYSRHNDDLENTTGVLSLLAEGRYLFRTAAGKMIPYVAGRAGWVRASASDVDVDGDGVADIGHLSASGFNFGGGGGVMINLSPTVQLDLGAVFHSVSLGDVDADGSTIPNSDSNGTAFQLRAGVSFRLGRA